MKFTIDKFVKKFNRNKRMPEEYVAYIISCVCRERERERGEREGGREGGEGEEGGER